MYTGYNVIVAKCPCFPIVLSEKCGFTRQHLTIAELMPRTRHSVRQHGHLEHWSTCQCRTSFFLYDLGGQEQERKKVYVDV